jgi:diguanylate cyclase (GGDEF)-like protein
MSTSSNGSVGRATGFGRDPDDSVRQLVIEVEPVSPEAPADHVYDRFTLDKLLHAIPIVDGVEPVGLVTRLRFCPEHAARYGRSESAAPIARYMDPSPLILDESATIGEAAECVLEDGARAVYDGFIVTYQGCYRGVGSGHALLRALTERGQREQHRVTYHDHLTGLPNRPLFDDRLAFAIAAAERARTKVAVLFVDLDQFKAVNDAHGAAVGDELLKRVGSRLRQVVRKGDTIARLGSDEFGIVLPAIRHVEAARHVARKIVESFNPPFHVEGADLCISCTVGIAVFPDDASTARRVMRCADRAAYHAKQVRNTFEWYNEDLAPPESPSVCTYGSLRQAIEQRRLSLVYQPQVDLATGRICGVEALVRWPEEEGPGVPANEIIAVAESSGLIAPLAEWVLTTACQQMRSWHDDGVFVVRMAVNVSGVQLRQHALAAIVERTLHDTGVPPAALELEITESLIMQNEATVLGTVRELKGLGVRLSIDDFGTGYSSLSRLVQLPVDSLKLDRTFVEPLGQDQRATLLAGGVIALAHRLELKVIAEGVETAEQLRTLRAHRCDVMQGYYFSRPVPADRIAAMVGDGLGWGGVE